MFSANDDGNDVDALESRSTRTHTSTFQQFRQTFG